MQITRDSIETATGPSDWFSGTVYIDSVATPAGAARIQAVSVHFTPGRADHPRDRGGRPLPASRRPDRGDPSRRQRLLRAR